MNSTKIINQVSRQIAKETGADRRYVARQLRKNGSIGFGWREPAESIDDRPFEIALVHFKEDETFDGWTFSRDTIAPVISWPGAADPRPNSTTYYTGYSRLY